MGLWGLGERCSTKQTPNVEVSKAKIAAEAVANDLICAVFYGVIHGA